MLTRACHTHHVIPAEAGTQDTSRTCKRRLAWIPAFAGMTE